MTENREQQLKKIKQEVINCKRCPLYKTRTYPVVGEGNHQAQILFCGEAPGKEEDQTGRPFCGRAGKVLDRLLKSAAIKREEVYICNILKCRPPGNRDPKPEEIEACTPYLEGQIKIIKPELIATLGNFSTRFIFKRYNLRDKIQGISKIHGEVFSSGSLLDSVKILPLYHPAVVTYNPNMMDTLKQDFEQLKNVSNQ